MGAYERFTPVIIRDQLSSTETELIEDLVALNEQRGDILYHDGTQWQVLHIGTTDQVLTVTGGLPAWETNDVAAGTVTSVSVVTANGVSGTVADATTTPAITLVLGNITPASVTSSGVVRPASDDGASLGASGQAWSDLFLASGGIIDFAGGDVTLTHGANVLTLAGGDLALGVNSLTLTGSIASTGSRVTKGWFTDLEVTNAIAGSITGNAATIAVADEVTDTSCFVLFVTAATGNLAAKTNAGLAFNSNTGILTATGFSGPLTGNVTGNVSGTAATVTGAAQTSITSLGTLTALDVDNININGNTISSTAGTDLLITPLAGQQLILDGSIEIDGTLFRPASDDGVTLGDTTHNFSDLFLASGAVINFAADDMTITHAANSLTFAGGTVALGVATVTTINALTITSSTGTFTLTAAKTFAVTNTLTLSGTDGTVMTFPPTTATIARTDAGQTFTGVQVFTSPNIATDIAPTANDGASLGTASEGFSDLFLATGGNILVANANAKRTLILSAAGGSPTTTIPCAGPTKVEAATNDIDYWVLDFDATTEERAFWNVQMPDNWDASTITAIFVWTNAAGLTTETVAWGIKARTYADSDAIDQAYGSEITTSDTWLAQNDVHISAASTAITIGGTPAGGQWVVFNVGRKVASDNMTGDARLMMVKIEYGINQYSD